MKFLVDGSEWRIEFAHKFTGSGKNRRRVTLCTVAKKDELTGAYIVEYSSETRLSTKRRVPPVLIDLEQAGDILQSVSSTLFHQFGLTDDFKKAFSVLVEQSAVVAACAAEIEHAMVKHDIDSRQLACTIALGKAVHDKALRKKFLCAWNNRSREKDVRTRAAEENTQ